MVPGYATPDGSEGEGALELAPETVHEPDRVLATARRVLAVSDA
jgi:hypothetical protein